MTRMTRPDCAVMCNLVNTHTHTQTLTYTHQRYTVVLCIPMGLYIYISKNSKKKKKKKSPKRAKESARAYHKTRDKTVTEVTGAYNAFPLPLASSRPHRHRPSAGTWPRTDRSSSRHPEGRRAALAARAQRLPRPARGEWCVRYDLISEAARAVLTVVHYPLL